MNQQSHPRAWRLANELQRIAGKIRNHAYGEEGQVFDEAAVWDDLQKLKDEGNGEKTESDVSAAARRGFEGEGASNA